MSKLNDAVTEGQRELEGYENFTAGGLAINAASAATFKSTSAYAYTIDGVFKTKAALAAQTFTAGHATQNIGTTQYYVIGLDALGNVNTYQGIIETTYSGASFVSVPTLPDVPNGVCPIGIIKVLAGTVAFVPGTTPLDTVGLTVTYFDINLIPSILP